MSKALFYNYLILLATNLLFVHNTFSQTCPSCNHTTSYNTEGGNTLGNPTQVGNQNNNWTNNYPAQAGIPRFPNATPNAQRFYSWNVGGNNSINILGLVLEENVQLTIGRGNNNETPIVEITGGCVTVKKNAILRFTYFSELENLNICVEDGGSIVFDSDAQGGSSGKRDDFVFDKVVINLQGPNATLDFGNADIKIIGNDGLAINGHTGSEVCTGDPLTPPSPSGSSGNISWTGQTNICEILNFRILPVEYIYFKALHNPTLRNNKLEWATAKEVGNSHFVVERSINSIDEWQELSIVEGVGFTDEISSYKYLDENLPLAGGNIYYRLRQVDFSEKEYMSRVINTRILPSISSSIWKIYPNPTTGQINLELAQLAAYADQEINIKITGIKGNHFLLTGLELRSANEQLSNFFNKATKGIYVVQIGWDSKVEHFKIVKE